MKNVVIIKRIIIIIYILDLIKWASVYSLHPCKYLSVILYSYGYCCSGWYEIFYRLHIWILHTSSESKLGYNKKIIFTIICLLLLKQIESKLKPDYLCT